jgi:ferredoxin
VLALILAFTIGTGELIFRPYDPYYVLFSAHGHEVKFWSYLVVGLILFVGVFLPMAWCRYLCPLGGTLWPFSRIAWLRLKRSNTACTDCGKCDAACPHGIPVSKVEIVDSGECTLCMECTEVCPSREALVVNAPGLPKTPVPAWTVAILVIIASTLGYLSAGAFTYSSYEHKYTDSTMPVGQIETMSFFVDGVMCVDTAITAAKQLENNSGAVSLSAYASSNRLDITFDSSQTNADALVDLIEAPVWNLEASEFQFGIFKVREVKSKSQ